MKNIKFNIYLLVLFLFACNSVDAAAELQFVEIVNANLNQEIIIERTLPTTPDTSGHVGFIVFNHAEEPVRVASKENVTMR